MWSWIATALLYVLVLVLFRLVGGVGAAGEALRSWGRASSTVGGTRGSSG